MINVTDEFFSLEDFAETATYTNPSGVATDIPVIFDAPFHVVTIAGMEATSSDPSVTCRTCDVADADSTSTIEYNGVTYFVREPQPDGTGITRLFLSKD